MFGPGDFGFGPEGVPCAAPIATEPPPGWTVAWEDCGSCYKMKLYPLDVFQKATWAFLDSGSLGLAQETIDDLIKHYSG